MAERRDDLWTSLKEAGRRASDFLFRGRLTGVVLLVLIVALTGVVVHLVKVRLLRSAHFRVDPSTVRFGDLPEWAPERIASELRQRCRGLPARPILDPLLDVELREALEGHPWVGKVDAVRRRYPNFIEADLTLRRPLARLDVRARTLTLDREGTVLEDAPDRTPQGLLYIIRATPKAAGVIPKPGSRFQAAPIQHGIAVARELFAHQDHVASPLLRGCEIDVSNVGRRDVVEITLRLASGTEVKWGSAPGSELGPIEIPVADKLNSLRFVDDKYPGLKGVKWVDVTTETCSYQKDG